MSIESNLKSIAESLAVIAQHIAHPQVTVDQPATTAPDTVKADAPPPPATTEDKAPPPPPPAADPVVAPMTPEELNALLVTEFKRLGGREPIAAVMGAAPFSADSITALAPEQYQPLIDAVRALTQ